VALAVDDDDTDGDAGMSELQRLEGRTALVTGGARGIGAAIVERLADEGAAVVVADRLTEAAGSLAAAQRARGRQAIAHAVDLTDLGEIAAMVDAAIAWRGALDILVNNAGVDLPGSVLEATTDEWSLQLDVNLRAPFFAIQAAARHMVARGRGKIVNTVSTSGFASSSTPNVIYDLTKGGLRQLTISAAVELAPHGVNVNGVAPGTIATELTMAVLDTPEKLERATARIPRGAFGQPADIAAAVAYLSSSDADYVHGHVLVVDGGWLAI
jgi:NAD(P)-dependent dehydrogenase (short-subunit alcohol dehydrogenase family)